MRRASDPVSKLFAQCTASRLEPVTPSFSSMGNHPAGFLYETNNLFAFRCVVFVNVMFFNCFLFMVRWILVLTIASSGIWAPPGRDLGAGAPPGRDRWHPPDEIVRRPGHPPDGHPPDEIWAPRHPPERLHHPGGQPP